MEILDMSQEAELCLFRLLEFAIEPSAVAQIMGWAWSLSGS